MNSDRIELLDSNLADTSRVLSHWGVGTFELLDKKFVVEADGKK